MSKNLIDCLSVDAKSELVQYGRSNVGCISVPDENFAEFFSNSSVYGRYYIREYVDDKVERTSLLLINGDTSDSGNLLGFLRKTSQQYKVASFLYRGFDKRDFLKIENPEFAQIKYNGAVVKLSTIRSFHSRFSREW